MDISFIMKKIVSITTMPLSISLLILFIGLLFLNTKNIQKAKLFLTIGFMSLIVIAYQPFSNFLIEPLKNKYSKLIDIPDNVTHILLLGGDLETRGWEVLRLYHKIKDVKIITSGFKGKYDTSEAIRTANIFYNLGVPKNDIIIHDKPKDTKEEAIRTKTLLGTKPFILVTSAYHMPRAMALFRKEGLNPIAAPADIRININKYISIPSGNNMKNTEIALHEYFGLLWAKIRGQI